MSIRVFGTVADAVFEYTETILIDLVIAKPLLSHDFVNVCCDVYQLLKRGV